MEEKKQNIVEPPDMEAMTVTGEVDDISRDAVFGEIKGNGPNYRNVRPNPILHDVHTT